MIKVAIDGGDFVPGANVQSGIQRLVDSFLKNIPINKGIQFNYYYFGQSTKPKFYSKNISFKKLPAKLFGSVGMPLQILRDGNQVFLGFSGNLPHLLSLASIKKIIFLHDLGFYDLPKFYPTADRLKRQTEFALKNSDKIVVFSDYVKNQLKSRAVKVYAGTDHLVKIAKTSKLANADYFLYVGVIKPIKNIEALFFLFDKFLTASDRRNYKLILIGPHEDYYYQKLLKLALYNKLKNNLLFVTNVTDSELAQYYTNATALINVSYAEGFCYPVFEALSLGTPVIVNDLPLYREFLHHFQGLFIGTTNDKIVKQMVKLAGRTKPYRTYKTYKSNTSYPYFTWADFSQKIVQIASSEA